MQIELTNHPAGLEAPVQTLSVVTWNMNQRPGAWDYLRRLRDDHGVQIALLQEAVPPPDRAAWAMIVPDPSATDQWRLPVPRNVKRREYASAIAVLDPALSLEPVAASPLGESESGWALPWFEGLRASHPGQFAVVRGTVGGKDLILVSLYGIWEYGPEGSLTTEITLHRALSDLTRLFVERGSAEVVLAGDLNLFWNTKHASQHRFNTVFDRLAAYGVHLAGPFRNPDEAPLADCTCGRQPDCGPECDMVETFRLYRANARPYRDDYVFATAGLRAQSCAPVLDPAIRDQSLSDHWPVIAHLAMS